MVNIMIEANEGVGVAVGNSTWALCTGLSLYWNSLNDDGILRSKKFDKQGTMRY